MTSYLFLALADAIISFILFRYLYLRNKTTWLRAVLVMAALIFAIPAVLFLSNYLLHIPDGTWFINFHSLPGAEASSGLVGAILGVMFACSRVRPNWIYIPVLTVSMIIGAILLVIPFVKQILYKLDYSQLENRWNNGICQQSSGSTCVPSSCATVIRVLGGNLTERELATEAGTTERGTEIWYMMRAIRRHGYEMEPLAVKSLKEMQAPAILGVKIGTAGHVVALISMDDASLKIADPLLSSPQRYTWKDFDQVYNPASIYFVIRHVGR